MLSLRNTCGTMLIAGTALAASSVAIASSHREAPQISKDQFADNTDTYVFISPENDNNIVLAASWIPFEAPDGGPNYFEWDDNATYYIYVDNDGDAEPEWTYTLTSRTVVGNDQTFLYNTNTINSKNDPDWNRRQFVTITETNAMGSTTTLVNDQLTIPVNIGNKSTPDYDDLVQQGVFNFNTAQGAGKAFAGQTDDAFFVDLQVFDLLTLRGQAAPIGYEEGPNMPTDSLSGFNAHTLVIELPIDRLTSDGEDVLGVWSTSERNDIQVSRLGMPLVNEVVFPYAIKDTFNAIPPSVDLSQYLSGAMLQRYVENPEVGQLLCDLYGVPLPADSNNDCDTEFDSNTFRSGRGDLVDIFLQGMVLAQPFTINTANGPLELGTGFNINRPDGVQPSEMIRINTTIKGSLCAPNPSPLGVIGGDACGYPNGRRLMDDVTDISLLAVGGAVYEVLDDRDISYSFNPALLDILVDGVNENDQEFSETFPYFATAQAGQSHINENPVNPPMMTAAQPTLSIDGGGGATGIAGLLGLLGLLCSWLGFSAVRSRRTKS